MLFIFAWGVCKAELSHHNCFFPLAILLQIVTNTFLSVSSGGMHVCHGSLHTHTHTHPHTHTHTHVVSVVGEMLLALCETIWWSSSPKCTLSPKFYSSVKKSASPVSVWTPCGLWAQHPFEVKKINSNNNTQCICAHSTKKSITSGLEWRWHKYTQAIFNLNTLSRCKD